MSFTMARNGNQLSIRSESRQLNYSTDIDLDKVNCLVKCNDYSVMCLTFEQPNPTLDATDFEQSLRKRPWGGSSSNVLFSLSLVQEKSAHKLDVNTKK